MSEKAKHNETIEGQWFSADRPVRMRERDRLGRRQFAEAIAKAVGGWRGQDSLVIGLYGPWGTGKSSIKNMAIEVIKENKDNPVIIAEFNAWEFANRDRLTESFFDQIGISLDRGTIGSQKHRKTVLEKWRRYAAYLQASGAMFEILRKPLKWILLITGVFLTGSLMFASFWVSIAMGLVMMVSGGLLFSAKIAESLTKFLQVSVEVGRKTLEEVKQELALELASLPAPLLIILDDLDRLTPAELQLMFQLIKVNADFPNMVYLALFDRGAVEKNIEKILEVDGRDYIEKIVQVGFDVPAIERQRLQKVFFEGLDATMADERVLKRFNPQRWGNLFLGALQGYFENLRDVNRFLSTFSFHVSLFRGDDAFEVNPIDLIGIEVLRVFEPEVYGAMSVNKGVLTQQRSQHGQEDESRRVVQAIVDKGSVEGRERVREILKQLFPPAEWVFGGSTYSGDFEETWYRDLRVCSKNVFDRYFLFAIPQDDVSQSTLDRLLRVAGDRDGLRTELKALGNQRLLSVVLDRLEAYKETISLDYALPFTTAVFDISEDIPEERGGSFVISSAMHAERILYWNLRRMADKDARFLVLRQAIEATSGLFLPVQLVSLEAQRAEKQRNSSEELVTDESVVELKQVCLRKIETAASNGSLLENSNLLYILYRWREWGGAEGARAFCENLANNSDGAIRLVKIFLARSTSTGFGDYVGKENWYIRLKDVENFIPFETLEAALQNVSVDSLKDKDPLALEEFRKAVERRRRGKPDYDGMFSRDEDD